MTHPASCDKRLAAVIHDGLKVTVAFREALTMSDKTKIDEHKEQELPRRTNQFIALTILVLTICATFSSLYAGGNSRKGILAQNQATDLWAYYQAKSIKQTIYKAQLDALQADTDTDPAKLTELSAKFQSEIDRYEAEQKDIKTQAVAKGIERDGYLALNRGFARALTFLQIAIMLASLSTLMKQIYFWYGSMALGAFGMVLFFKTMLFT